MAPAVLRRAEACLFNLACASLASMRLLVTWMVLGMGVCTLTMITPVYFRSLLTQAFLQQFIQQQLRPLLRIQLVVER